MGLVQLSKLDGFVAARRRLAQARTEMLERLEAELGVSAGGTVRGPNGGPIVEGGRYSPLSESAGVRRTRRRKRS